MKKVRAILSGSFVWVLVFSSFTLLSFIPGTTESEFKQYIIVCALIIPFAWAGAAFYYKSGDVSNGFWVGLAMATVALLLDAIITVPLVEIPRHSSYSAFFTNPVLWILIVEDVTVVYFYWRLNVKTSANK